MNKKDKKIKTEISSEGIHGQPVDAFDLINKYGTYEIQPTSDSDNEFPQIAEGLPKEKKSKS